MMPQQPLALLKLIDKYGGSFLKKKALNEIAPEGAKTFSEDFLETAR